MLSDIRSFGASMTGKLFDIEGLRTYSAQIRAARALLGWTQDELSRRSGLAKRSIASAELGTTRPYRRTLSILEDTFTTAGIAFSRRGRRIEISLDMDAVGDAPALSEFGCSQEDAAAQTSPSTADES